MTIPKYPTVVFDTNRILTSTPRRFFGSLQEYHHQPVFILPTVKVELLNQIPLQENEYYLKVFNRKTREKTLVQSIRPHHVRQIIIDLATAAESWIREELENLDQNQTIFQCIDPKSEHHNETQYITAMIPKEFFKEERKYPLHRDRSIVSEAIYYNTSLIVTNNIHSIYHRHLNEWVKKHFPEREQDLVVTSDKLIRQIAPESNREKQKMIAEALLGAALPAHPGPEIHAIVERFRMRLYHSELPETAGQIKETIETHPDIKNWINTIYRKLPEKTRKTEDRRLKKVKEVEEKWEIRL